MTHRFRVVPASYVVFRRGDEVLLQLRQNTGFMDGHWACAAAGHVEEGETALEAASREALEELGVVIHADQLTPLTAMHRTQRNGRPEDERVDFFFECRQWQGPPVLREPQKAARLDWFALDALPEPVVPHERLVFEALRTGTLPAIVTFGF